MLRVRRKLALYVGLASASVLAVILWSEALRLENIQKRERAYRATCQFRLQTLCEWIVLYRQDHGGAAPQDLTQLVDQYHIKPELLQCPSAERFGAPGSGLYVYAGGEPQSEQEPLVTESIRNHELWREKAGIFQKFSHYLPPAQYALDRDGVVRNVATEGE